MPPSDVGGWTSGIDGDGMATACGRGGGDDGMSSMLFRGRILGLPKLPKLGFRETSAGEGMGGDVGRDLVGGDWGTSRGRGDRDRERDLRYGRTRGTSRNWLEPAMA